MTQTILTDGRTVKVDECHSVEYALGAVPNVGHNAELIDTGPHWVLACQCCDGNGSHGWSPPSYFNGASGPDSGHYGCGPCKGTGEFKVEMP